MNARPFRTWDILMVVTGLYRVRWADLEDATSALELIEYVANRPVKSFRTAQKLIRPRRKLLLDQLNIDGAQLAEQLRRFRVRFRWWRSRGRKIDDLTRWLRRLIRYFFEDQVIYLNPIPARSLA